MRLSIRPATVLDAETLGRLEAELHGREPRDEEAVAAEIADAADSSTWLAVGDGEPVGYLVTRALGPGQPRALEVAALLVTAGRRRQGVGTALLDYAIGDAPAQAPLRPADPATSGKPAGLVGGGNGENEAGDEAAAFFRSCGFAPERGLLIR